MDIRIVKPSTITIQFSTPVRHFAAVDKDGNILFDKNGEGFKSAVFNIAITPVNIRLKTTPQADVKVSLTRLKRHRAANLRLPTYEHEYRVKKIVQDPKLKGPAAYFPVLGEIHIGPAFYGIPLWLRKFVLFHELGHQFYVNETKADTYALKKYLQAGGTPEGAFLALSDYLRTSGHKAERLQNLKNYIYGSS